MKGSRVLKKHREAVREVLGKMRTFDGDGDAMVEALAEAVVTAYDGQMKYVVVNDSHVVFGPYGTREAAHKAIDRGHCADHHGQRAMVLPMKPAPTARTASGIIVPPPTTQLPLWEVLADADAAGQ